MARDLLSRAVSESRAAHRVLRAIRRAHGGTSGVRTCRRSSRDLFDLEVSQGDALRRAFAAASLDRLAYGRHGGGESAVRIDPARRDDPALWRRYAMDQSRDWV